MFTRHVGRHNQNTYAPQPVLRRDRSPFFAPAGHTYMILPRNRGVVDGTTKDVTYLYAPIPKSGTSSPKTYGKRTALNWGLKTSIFY